MSWLTAAAPPPGPDPATPALAEQVRDALAHLYDPGHLQTHPLAAVAVGSDLTSRGRALQRALLEAIEALAPAAGSTPGPKAVRQYRLLKRHYVDGLTPQAVQAELLVGKSEYYRAHQQAVAAVASLLAERLGPRSVAAGAPPSAPPARAAAPPVYLTGFVGREAERADLTARLAATRLLTLTGAGGCGKTRLAAEVVGSLGESFADGVCFVDLAPLVDEERVPLTVLSALGLTDQPGRTPLQRLVEHLRPRALLLLLDNCEHLVGACAQLATALLQECAGLRVLATSREVLGVPGEVAWRVPSLATPDPGEVGDAEQIGRYEAVRLFVERARLVQPSFDLTDRNAAAVAEVCARLDGVPLALELAAARLRVLPVEQIAARLDQRFRLLTGGRTAPRRHQTLRELVDWSHDLLSEPERILFRRLAVFVAGWTLDAAEDVAGYEPIERSEVLELLTGLVDKSLVGAAARDGRAHYRFLETIRQYAEEKLVESGEAAATMNRHRDWWLEQSRPIGPERVEASTEGPEGRARLAELVPLLDNLRAVLAWCASSPGGAGPGLELARNTVWLAPSDLEKRRWLETFLRLAPERTAIRGLALQFLGQVLRWQRELEPALASAEEAVAILTELGDPVSENRARAELAMARANLGEHARAIDDLEACLAAARQIGDRPRITQCLRDLGVVAIAAGQLARARVWLEESLRLARAADSRINASAGLLRLAILDRLEGDYARARARIEEALLVRGRDELWLPVTLELMRAELANLARAEGQLDEARAGLADVLRAMLDQGLDAARSEIVSMIAMVEIEQGALGRGVCLVAACDRGPGPIGGIHSPDVRVEVPEYLARARAALGEDAYAEAWSRGQAMTLEAAIELALMDAQPPRSRSWE